MTVPRGRQVRAELRPRISVAGLGDETAAAIANLVEVAHIQAREPIPPHRDVIEIDGVFCGSGHMLDRRLAAIVWVEKERTIGTIDGPVDFSTALSTHEIAQLKSGDHDLDALVADTVFGTCPEGSLQCRLEPDLSMGGPALFDEYEPLVVDGHNHVLALRYVLAGQPVSRFALPSTATGRVRWAQYALDRWHKEDPVRFPVPPRAIVSSVDWYTEGEIVAAGALATKKAEIERLISEMKSEIVDLERNLDQQHDERSSNEARLIESKSDELVDAVAIALEEFGFSVRDRDKERKDEGENDKLEDLIVNHPDHADDDALVEVKGYGKGATVADITKTERFVRRYLSDNGHEPAQRWHVVNTEIGKPPEQRILPFRPTPDDVQVYADDGGLIIPTLQLFKAVRAAKLGEVDASAVMESLWTETGMWKFEPPSEAE